MVSNKRKYTRYNKRLQTSYTDGAEHFTGFSADISEKGLFIAARRILAPGTELSMRFTLPDGAHAGAKGIVRRAIKGMSQISRGGMGVELTSYDDNFYDFLKSVIKDFQGGSLCCSTVSYYRPPTPDGSFADTPPTASPCSEGPANSQPSPTEAQPQTQDDSQILACPQCGAKNKVPLSRLAHGPKCGRCKAELIKAKIEPAASARPEAVKQTETMNRPETTSRPEAMNRSETASAAASASKPEPNPSAAREESTTIECSNCGAKNKVPVSLMVHSPKCGRCREPLF